VVRVRGGNKKFRALRLDAGNFSWASEGERRAASASARMCGRAVCGEGDFAWLTEVCAQW
jgi:hypothetical protein